MSQNGYVISLLLHSKQNKMLSPLSHIKIEIYNKLDKLEKCIFLIKMYVP